MYKTSNGKKYNVFYLEGKREDDICANFLKRVDRTGSTFFQGDWIPIAQINEVSRLGTSHWWFRICPSRYAWDKEVRANHWRSLLFMSVWFCEYGQHSSLSSFHRESSEQVPESILILEPIEWVEDVDNSLKQSFWVRLAATYAPNKEPLKVCELLDKFVYLDSNQKSAYLPRPEAHNPSSEPTVQHLEQLFKEKDVRFDSQNLGKFISNEVDPKEKTKKV